MCSGEPGKALSRGITLLNKLLLKRGQVMALGSQEREKARLQSGLHLGLA